MTAAGGPITAVGEAYDSGRRPDYRCGSGRGADYSGGSFLALGAGRRAALFSVGLFVCVFVCFSIIFVFFWVPFWLWVLGAVLLFFPSGFLCVFLFVFSLLFGFF